MSRDDGPDGLPSDPAPNSFNGDRSGQERPTQTEHEGETLDMPEGLGTFSSGQVLGERYQILEMLGRGGMGEVWHAFDLKLRVDVALKALREDFFKSERRLELLRQEVRAAREVVSPNVCRIFDLIEVEGRELVSMEYVDGATLLGVLQERGPLELKEAQDIASQFLAGLEAIHKVGLVHRDIKPENIMLTRAGRVVVMDFGLARQETEGGGSVSGTPAYMAPEQAAGETLDPRADVYSAGVVLAEMVSPDGIKSYESRQSVWEGVRSEPAQVPDSPWAPVISRAVARDRLRRQNSAHTLIRELEDVTLRVEGADDLHPYPGLASFTESDAEYFFGREAEVEQMWRKLEGPARMLGLAGPSGAGKSSFLRAGLLATKQPTWSHVICTPGSDPRASLRRALISELEGDSEALRELAAGDEEATVSAVSRWKWHNEHALVIVDQFEELFTLNTDDEQQRFGSLLARLVLDADVEVVLSMRDDFLFHCHRHESLRPVLPDLTMLGPPEGLALRRALVQPATKCGYRFEDDELVDEMLAEVENERGALPLLAFAASRLWELRDRETGLLTRQAYRDIGGVGGALARHAEATIDRIGTDRIAIVRELFRNLVTAEGTRAVREWDDLLSVFSEDQRVAAADILRELIDARLLTSYEIREDENEPTRHVEIIHESLLANWPRLVRWQTQDADAVQLRDQLRQAARTWEEHDRSDDMLWTGAAYREFASWRERYPGGLTDTEEAFGDAMTAFATRRRRRRRIAAAAALVVLTGVASVLAAMWMKSEREALRAEAATLLSQAQVELESYPSAAVAYATASLELSDSQEARQLALRALWKGPTALVVSEESSWEIDFTPDGQWLVQATEAAPHRLHVIGADGTDEQLEDVHGARVGLRMGPESGIFATIPWGNNEPWALWSAPGKKLLAKGRSGDPDNILSPEYDDLGRRRLLLIMMEDDRFFVDAVGFDGTSERLGALPFDLRSATRCRTAPNGRWFAISTGQDVYVIEVGDHDLSEPRSLGNVGSPVVAVDCDPLGHFVAAASEDGQIRLLDVTGESPPRAIQGPSGTTMVRITKDSSLLEAIRFDRERREVETWIWSLEDEEPTLLRHIDLGKAGGTGEWTLNPVERQIVSILNPDPKIRLWSLRVPADAEPAIMQRGEVGMLFRLAIHPQGQWLATSGSAGVALWPVARPYPTVIKRYEERVSTLVFGPEGRWLATSDFGSGTVRKWQLDGEAFPPAQIVYDTPSYGFGIAASPDGKQILLGGLSPPVKLLSPGIEAPVDLPGDVGNAWGVAFSPDGRFAAAGGKRRGTNNIIVSVWNLASLEQVKLLELGAGILAPIVHFAGGGLILSGNDAGLVRWDLESGNKEVIVEEAVYRFAISSDGSRVLFGTAEGELGGVGVPNGRVVLLDLGTGSKKPLLSHGRSVSAVAMDAEGTMAVTGDTAGVIRVGLLNGDEPHLLLGNPNEVLDIAVDPGGRWIASASGTEVRLWPMPDLSKPPLHTLPREELIAKLKTLTNLRVVRDPESATGWTLTHDPFPGWETVPTW